MNILPPQPRGRARNFGLPVGTRFASGPLNALTDVAGVRVGHATLFRGDGAQAGPALRTGVTAIWPHEGNPFHQRVYAATSVLNGYGVMTGILMIAEWGLLGSPIVITDTTHVGLAYHATNRYLMRSDKLIGDVDVLIPVITECDDGFLNDNRAMGLSEAEVVAALDSAKGGTIEEGCVGAGTGTQQFDFKGGIGTASRLVVIGGRTYAIGILLNTNYGTRHQLVINGKPIGRLITGYMPVRHHEGSCIGILATDLPLHPNQLRRLATRIGLGLARTGSVGNDGSGEIFLAFSTAQRIPREAEGWRIGMDVLIEGQFWTQGSPFNDIFEAVVEATEEAALNALCQADTVTGRNGRRLYAMPVEEVLAILNGIGPS